MHDLHVYAIDFCMAKIIFINFVSHILIDLFINQKIKQHRKDKKSYTFLFQVDGMQKYVEFFWHNFEKRFELFRKIQISYYYYFFASFYFYFLLNRFL